MTSDDEAPQTAVLTLDPHPAAVRAARELVARTCAAAGTVTEECDAAVLLASELVTNAFIHGRSEARISVRAAGTWVRVEVADDNSRHPIRVAQDPDALDGRGMSIVDRVATTWGVRDDPYGKTIWFEMGPQPGPEPGSTASP